jgi:hypothetical protein
MLIDTIKFCKASNGGLIGNVGFARGGILFHEKI